MMQIERMQEMGNNYIKISGIKLYENSSGFQMLRYNQVKGILAPVSRLIDEKESFYFEIKDCLSLEQYIQKSHFEKKILIELICQIETVYEVAKEYLIEENELILTRESVCIDTNGMVFLPFLPRAEMRSREEALTGENDVGVKEKNEGILAILETVMIYMDHADKELIFFVYELYKYCKEEVSCIYNLKKILDQVEENMQEKSKNENRKPILKMKSPEINKNDMKETKTKMIERSVIEKKTFEKANIIFGGLLLLGLVIIFSGMQSTILKHEISKQYDYVKVSVFIIAIILLEVYAWVKLDKPFTEEQKEIEVPRENVHTVSEETVLLRTESISKKFILKSIDKLEKDIMIYKFPFIIGKLDCRVDGIIEHEGISRIHGEFRWEEEELLFCDLGSTNGTYINNEELVPHHVVNVHVGDQLQFGVVLYQVELFE